MIFDFYLLHNRSFRLYIIYYSIFLYFCKWKKHLFLSVLFTIYGGLCRTWTYNNSLMRQGLWPIELKVHGFPSRNWTHITWFVVKLSIHWIMGKYWGEYWELNSGLQGHNLLFYHWTIFTIVWWNIAGSNRWPSACKAGALPIELMSHYGAPYPNRTGIKCLQGTCFAIKLREHSLGTSPAQIKKLEVWGSSPQEFQK